VVELFNTNIIVEPFEEIIPELEAFHIVTRYDNIGLPPLSDGGLQESSTATGLRTFTIGGVVVSGGDGRVVAKYGLDLLEVPNAFETSS